MLPKWNSKGFEMHCSYINKTREEKASVLSCPVLVFQHLPTFWKSGYVLVVQKKTVNSLSQKEHKSNGPCTLLSTTALKRLPYREI